MQIARGGHWIRGVLAVVVVVTAACSSTETTATPADGTIAQPGSVAAPGGSDWPVLGHDDANTRTNVHETAITAANVSDLALSWNLDGFVGVSGTPAVVDGTAYAGDWTGTVRALDPATGDVDWEASVPGAVTGAVAVDGDGVYVAAGRTLTRLDRETGAEVWTTEVHDHPMAQIAASPVVVDDLVIQGVASGEVVMPLPEYTFRGSVSAHDATTGEQRWRFETTAGDETSGPGVGVWSTPAIDRERGLLYVGTGNTYDEPSAPLGNSLLALGIATGELAWSAQYTAPDVFSAGRPGGKDADVGASPNLWTSDGRDLVGVADKAGTYHAHDRDSGEAVWSTELTPGSMFGGAIGSAAFVDGRLVVVSNVGDPDTNSPTNVARVFALDPAGGKILWTAEDFEGMIFAPVGAVPGVAFIGTTEGVLAALATDDGSELWRHQAPDKTGCGPSIVDGRVLWGYGFTLFQGPGDGGLLSFEVRT